MSSSFAAPAACTGDAVAALGAAAVGAAAVGAASANEYVNDDVELAAAAAGTATSSPAAALAAGAAKDDDMVLVQEDDGTQVLYRKLGRVLERPGGLGVVALGLASSVGPAVQGAVNSLTNLAQSASAKSETTRIKR